MLFSCNITFTFKGEITVEAESREQAMELIKNNVGMVSNGLQNTLNDDQIDYTLPVHPEMRITNLHEV